MHFGITMKSMLRSIYAQLKHANAISSRNYEALGESYDCDQPGYDERYQFVPKSSIKDEIRAGLFTVIHQCRVLVLLLYF
jgi:hypothetical protein